MSIRFFLFPFAWMYQLIVSFRNLFFDIGLMSSREFPIGVIVIGNLAMGGSGKTPHIDYLINLLNDKYAIVFLSRGYKRKTNGFVLATPASDFSEIGDEPVMIKQKYPNIPVAVCIDRVEGVATILSHESISPPDVILLDDAYQHRHIRAGINILLTEYSCPYYRDFLFPVGTLREGRNGKKRADIIIVTKCPSTLDEAERKSMLAGLGANVRQSVYFSNIRYGEPINVFPPEEPAGITTPSSGNCLAICGIANPILFFNHVKEKYGFCEFLAFPDHHDYSEMDIIKIIHSFESLNQKEKKIFTTEKDAWRLKENKFLPDNVKKYLYYIPITVDFFNNDKEKFNQQIEKYVSTNKGKL